MSDTTLAAEILAIDAYGDTALHRCTRAERVKPLLNIGINIDAKNKNGYAPLHIAILLGHLDVAEVFIDAGADINVRNNYGSTPLHCAIACGSLEMVARLVDANANISAKNNAGKTPLHLSSMYGYSDTVAYLLNAGAKVDVRTYDCRTPLHYASSNGHSKIVALLLDAGAKVDAKTNSGNTALHYACMKGHASVVTVILDAGAAIDVHNRKKYTPLYYAKIYNHSRVIALLEECDMSDDDFHELMCTAPHYDRIDVASHLHIIDHGDRLPWASTHERQKFIAHLHGTLTTQVHKAEAADTAQCSDMEVDACSKETRPATAPLPTYETICKFGDMLEKANAIMIAAAKQGTGAPDLTRARNLYNTALMYVKQNIEHFPSA